MERGGPGPSSSLGCSFLLLKRNTTCCTHASFWTIIKRETVSWQGACPPLDKDPERACDGLIGNMWDTPQMTAPRQVAWSHTRLKPSHCRLEDDVHTYVYDLVSTSNICHSTATAVEIKQYKEKEGMKLGRW